MATVHRATPTLTALDPRGLVVRSVAYCRSTAEGPADVRIHRTEHDRAGWAVALWDPRLLADPSAPANLATLYSLRGHVLGTESVDAGWRRNLWGAAQQWMNAWDGRGTLRRNAFDLRLRPLAVFEQGGCTERYRYGDGTFPRNQRGQLIRHDDPAGTVLFTEYGVAGQALQHTRRFLQALDAPDWPEALAQRDALLEPAPGATSHTRFNAVAEVVEQTDAKGHRQLFSHTPSGQLRQVQLQLAGQGHRQTLVSAIRYDAQGRTEQETAGNGVVTTLTYRAEDGRLIRLHAAGPQVLQNLHYAYDPVGNVLSIEDQAQPVRYHANQRIDPVNRYTYDSLYQLIQATGWEAGAANKGPQCSPFADPAPRANYRQTYAYDAGGNLLTLAHQGPQSHGRTLTAAQHSNRCLPQRNGQPPTEAEIAAAFDANGNLLELHPGQTLAWDRRNQLQEVQPVQRDSAPDDSERYIYGGDGLRVRKVQSSQTHTRTVTREVRYLPGLEIRTRPSETLHVIVVQAGRNAVRVLHWETEPPVANDQIRYSASDHLGSCTLELDSAGAVISHETYHPFGTTAWFAGRSEVEARYKTVRYSNKERDATGLYYYGFRYYMPWLQRWVNPDPAGEVVGGNWYAFVSNAPVRFSDVQGLLPVDINDLTDEQVQVLGLTGSQVNSAQLMYESNFRGPINNEVIPVGQETFTSLQQANYANIITKAFLPYGSDNQRLDVWRSPLDNAKELQSVRSVTSQALMAMVLEYGVGNCQEHADIAFNLLASTQTMKPVFTVNAQGVDHIFAVIGDPRTLPAKELVIADPWPTFPMAHTANAGAFVIGDIVRQATAEEDPAYALDDRTLFRNARYDFPDIDVNSPQAIARLEKMIAIPTVFMQLFSLKDDQVGIDYSGPSVRGEFNKLPAAYVHDRIGHYTSYLHASHALCSRSGNE